MKSNKKNFLLVGLVLFLFVFFLQVFGSGGGETKNKQVIFDFATGKFDDMESDFTVEYRNNVTFTIKNINPFLFKVTINGETIDYFGTLPKEFAPVKTDGTEGEEKKDNGAKKSTTPTLILPNRLLTFMNKSEEEDYIKNLPEWLVNTINRACACFGSMVENAQLSGLQLEFPKTTGLFVKGLKTIREVYKEKQLKKEKEKELKKYVDNQIIELLNRCKLKLTEEKLGLGHKALQSVETFYSDLVAAIVDGNEYSLIENKVNRLVSDLILVRNVAKNDQLDKIVAYCNQQVNKARAIYDYEVKSINYDNHAKIQELNEHIGTFQKKEFQKHIADTLNRFREEFFTISHTIPTVEGDEVQFIVKIEQKDKENSTPFNQLQSPVNIRVRGGWKIDFSTGVFFAFNAHDRSYTIEELKSEPGKVVIKTGKDLYSITPLALALLHVHPRRASATNWSGVAFGLGTSDTAEISYYLGTGWMFGSKKRFVFNLGVVAKKIDILAAKYTLNEPLDQESDDLVDRRFQPRICLGFSYNLNN